MVVTFFGERDAEQLEVFSQVAREFGALKFARTEDKELRRIKFVEGDKPAILMEKQFREKRKVYRGDWSVNDLRKFVATKSMPYIIPFMEKTYKMIFGGSKDCLFVFYKDADQDRAAIKALV